MLRLRFADGELTVSAQTQDVGEARESLPMAFSGEPLEIGFNAEFLRDLCRKFSGQITVGIDARQGKVAVKGWKETTAMDAVELAQRCEQDGVARIIYTDISRDGALTGVNVEGVGELADAVSIPSFVTKSRPMISSPGFTVTMTAPAASVEPG